MISEEKTKWLKTVDTSIGSLEKVVDDLRDLYGQILLEDYPGENNEIQVLANNLDISITRKIECLASARTAKGWLKNDITLSDIREDISNLK